MAEEKVVLIVFGILITARFLDKLFDSSENTSCCTDTELEDFLNEKP